MKVIMMHNSKSFAAIVLFAALLFCCFVSAYAEEAQNITDLCEITAAGQPTDKVHDGLYTSYWTGREKRNPYLEFRTPDGVEAEYLYICFGNLPESWAIEEEVSGEWKTLIQGSNDYLHACLELGGKTHFRLVETSGKSCKFKINDVFVFSDGDLPQWVQRWQPAPEKADMLVLSAHPDDELIFFGGTIPTYDTERGKNVVVAYMTASNTTRSSELLNGLWHMGVRTYPVIGTFYDGYSSKLENAYKKWNKNSSRAFVMELIRKYRPDVMITHDVNGEYGHGAHRLCADVAQYCVENSSNPEILPDLAAEYGPWQVKKLYLHLYKENPIRMDWNVPLSSMNGKTALQLAQEAYELHITQANTDFVVTDVGETSCAEFGLAYTAVGPDKIGGDFFENIAPASDAERMSEEETSALSAYGTSAEDENVNPEGTDNAESAAEEPEQLDETPSQELHAKPEEESLQSVNEEENAIAEESFTAGKPYADVVWPDESQKRDDLGYLIDGEYVFEDAQAGLWFYASPTLVVRIDRKFDAERVITWYEADVFCDPAVEHFGSVLFNPEKPRQKHVQAALIARRNQVVFGLNTDYYTYRIGRKTITGMVIRNKSVFFERVPKANRSQFPNLDTLAMFEDGSWGVFQSDELTAEEYLQRGAVDVFSFGPYLVRDGEINPFVGEMKNGKTPQPRCAVGMVVPGQYHAILAEGRIKNESVGVSVMDLAEHMKAQGCTQALNLDGGQTAVMMFMGNQISRIGPYSGHGTNARTTTEIMGIGRSDLIDPEAEPHIARP